MVKVNPVRTIKDYKAALKRIDQLILKNPEEGTAAYDELDVLGNLNYENSIKHPSSSRIPTHVWVRTTDKESELV